MGAVDPKEVPQVQHILLGMWAQSEGRGLPGVASNLLLAVEAELGRVGDIEQRDFTEQMHLDELRTWQQGLRAIRGAIGRLGKTPQAGPDQSGSLKEKTGHPLSRHGFTSNAIYAAVWNVHDASKGREAIDHDLCAAYRRLQWWWIRVQTRVIEDARIGWEVYASPELLQAAGWDDQVALIDRLKHLTGISFDAVGRALRRMSSRRHSEFLLVLVECCVDDMDVGLRAFTHLEDSTEKWKSPDVGVQKERQSFVDAFRLVAEKILDPTSIKKRPPGGGGGGGGGSGSEAYGEASSDSVRARQRIHTVAPPDDLVEFERWIHHDEVMGVDEEELKEDEGVEAPRRTGFNLIDPADLKGHMARARAQSHYVAMVRQGFAWDHNTLSASERRVLQELVQNVCSAQDTSLPTEWWPKAMVAVAWVCGRPLEEVMTLACLAPREMGKAEDDLFGVGEIDGVGYWRWPLRLPNQIKVDPFTDAVPRVDHVLVRDGSGMALALVRAHRRRDVSRSQVFGWLSKPEHRLAKAFEVVKGLKGEVLDRTVTPALLTRDLRIALLNLAPDKTVAWMLAGTQVDAREPRMFYAAHTPDELVTWVARAHERIGIRTCAAATPPVSPGPTWPTSYAGAKFLPQLVSLRSLVWRAREQARQFPPLDLVHLQLLTDSGKTRGEATRTSGSRNPDQESAEVPSLSWTDVRRWRQWHDDVVFWVWLVQALQTSQRATRFPVMLYRQWLQERDRKWVSLEDKRTVDHDESRSGVITPMLSSAFSFLTHVQAAYRACWEARPKRRRQVAKPRGLQAAPEVPFGFVVFAGAARPSDLTPAWIRSHLESRFGLQWPVNFNRAALRRALSQLGMHGDGLDAFLGHGAMADRIHDRHSLFDVGLHHQALHGALKQWADEIDLKRLDLPVELRPTKRNLVVHQRRTLQTFKRKDVLTMSRAARPNPTPDAVGADFVRWQGFVDRAARSPRGHPQSGALEALACTLTGLRTSVRSVRSWTRL